MTELNDHESEGFQEWSSWVELTSQRCFTQPGTSLVLRLVDSQFWARDCSEANQMQIETEETSGLLEVNELWEAMRNLESPSSIVQRLEKGAVLGVQDFVVLRSWLVAAQTWRNKKIENFEDFASSIKGINRVITPEGNISETASPILSGLFERSRSLREKLEREIQGVCHRLHQKGVLQDKLFDVRNGRYVVPIRASAQGELTGIVHDASSSGQTVYVEPREVEALNNQLRKVQNDIQLETLKIMKELSEAVSPFYQGIGLATERLIFRDYLQAKARIAAQYGGKRLSISEGREFSLKQTHHPLLAFSISENEIVKNDLSLGPDGICLMISGPNTGGKTVLLKTFFLAGLAGRTGFFFPGAEEGNVPFFDQFFSDLGDPQSLKENLSSFSGRVLKIKRIIERATPRSLVLIDEMNSATDPEEGVALYRAFLDFFLKGPLQGAMMIATTHDPNLKVLSNSEPQVIVAGMKFDEQRGEPTYSLVMGVPGRSRALETAERLGLDSRLISKAKSFLSRAHQEYEEKLKDFEEESRKLEKERKKVEKELGRLEIERSEFKEEARRSLDLLREQLRQEMKRVLDSTSARVEEVRKRSAYTKANEAFEAAAADVLEQHGVYVQQEAESNLGELSVGDRVYLSKWKVKGEVLELLGKGKVKVAVKLKDKKSHFPPVLVVSSRELSMSSDGGEQNKVVRVNLPTSEVGFEIDIRGMRLADAQIHLEAYLDRAFREKLQSVKVIHGTGTGALRNMTRKLNEVLGYIKEMRDAIPEEGGAGVTLIYFDL